MAWYVWSVQVVYCIKIPPITWFVSPKASQFQERTHTFKEVSTNRLTWFDNMNSKVLPMSECTYGAAPIPILSRICWCLFLRPVGLIRTSSFITDTGNLALKRPC